MIERVIEFSIRRRWLVIAAAACLTIAGVAALLNTPVDAIPDLSENQVIVFTQWNGHSPQEIEQQVTFPLSSSLQGLPGVRVVRGSSDVNFSMIHVIFEDVISVEAARTAVGQRLTRANRELPPDALPYLAPESPATGQIFWYTVEGVGRDLRELREIQDWYVGPQISSVPGVAEVASVGGFTSEYQIEVDPHRLQLHGVLLADVVKAVGDSNVVASGHVMQKAGAEYIVSATSWLGQSTEDKTSESLTPQAIRDLENVVVPIDDRRSVRLGDLATVQLGPQPRRGAFEKDGNEVTGGVVSMRFGENPLALTERIRAKIDELQTSLPEGVRIVTVYDRTPLIRGAIHTVTRTLLEAIIAATVCVVIVLLHVRTSMVIAVTLPLATLSAFLAIWFLRHYGIADIQTNIMTLAGIVVSIGVLVDAAIVMAENAMYTLHRRFGDKQVRGDTRALLLPACKTVGRPIFFSILIMLLSFFPVFALEGAAGKMFWPLAVTKSAALVAAAVLAITLVPALCTLLVRGRLRGERDSWLVRSIMDVYRPVLNSLLNNPAPLAWILSATMLIGFAPLGARWLFLALLLVGIVACGMSSRTRFGSALSVASLIVVALIAYRTIRPLQHDLITPLSEGMVMDMPITVPLMGIAQSVDDLKARDMVLCRFPEVSMVVGKSGRAETPTDPAPLDMIETMVDFRPEHLWPRRKLRQEDAERHSLIVLNELIDRELIASPGDEAAREAAANAVVGDALARFDGLMREYAYQRNDEFSREVGSQLKRFVVERCVELLWQRGRLTRRPSASDIALIASEVPGEIGQILQSGPDSFAIGRIMRSVSGSLVRLKLVAAETDLFADSTGALGRVTNVTKSLLGQKPTTFRDRLYADARRYQDRLWSEHVSRLDDELVPRAAATFTRVVLEAHLKQQRVLDTRLAEAIQLIEKWRVESATTPRRAAAHHGSISSPPPSHKSQPMLDELQSTLADVLHGRLLLWKIKRDELSGFGGELDQALQMPGWTNVWTMPIQNRVDMLATGVNTTVGIRVLGRKLDDVVAAAEQVGAIVRQMPGAADVVVDPIRGKGYLDIRVDRTAAAKLGVRVADINQTVEAALGGTTATTAVEGRARRPVRVQFPKSWRDDEDALQRLPVIARPPVAQSYAAAAATYVTLADVADIRITEGPATVKSENGLLRTYVRLNVRGRGSLDFVAQAQRKVAAEARLPEGVHVEWTGQFEGESRARARLAVMMPIVVLLIGGLLYATYRDLADAGLVLLAIPGAIAGGMFFQWLCGFNFSVAVWVGYIACFGMAAATGIIMLVYLREAVAKAGGLEAMNLAQLRQAVLNGAVHRLRPKLLTEGTTIIGLAPMLWATGPGADVIRPMAAPVLGGILVADEVIDLLLPVLFYRVRKYRWKKLHGSVGTEAQTFDQDEMSKEEAAISLTT
jgi:Cu(I)/Ag(I) efflux system membrane protein CusA/SilA